MKAIGTTPAAGADDETLDDERRAEGTHRRSSREGRRLERTHFASNPRHVVGDAREDVRDTCPHKMRMSRIVLESAEGPFDDHLTRFGTARTEGRDAGQVPTAVAQTALQRSARVALQFVVQKENKTK